MIITQKQARETAKEWGYKRVPKRGRQYLRVGGKASIHKLVILEHDEAGLFHIFFE